MVPIPKRTYSRKADQGSTFSSSASWSSYTSVTDEHDKENVLKGKTRQAKKKALEEIKKSSSNFEEEIKSPSLSPPPKDPFDNLFSSPMRQDVKMKPLSFWTKKLNDFESKENEKKKKKKNLQLYEFSDSDPDSDSSAQGKKKAKQKPKVVRKKQPGNQYQLSRSYVKNKVPKSKAAPNRTHEGSLIREIVLLKKEMKKLQDKENKFTFETEAPLLGITSTPGRCNDPNIIGPSNFSFFSPISCLNSSNVNSSLPSLVNSTETCEKPLQENMIVDQGTPVKKIQKYTRRAALRSNTRRVSPIYGEESEQSVNNVTSRLEHTSASETVICCNKVTHSISSNSTITNRSSTNHEISNPSFGSKTLDMNYSSPKNLFCFSRSNTDISKLLPNSPNISDKSELFRTCVSGDLCETHKDDPQNGTLESSLKPSTDETEKYNIDSGSQSDNVEEASISYNESKISELYKMYELLLEIKKASQESTIHLCTSLVDYQTLGIDQNSVIKSNSLGCINMVFNSSYDMNISAPFTDLNDSECSKMNISEVKECEKLGNETLDYSSRKSLSNITVRRKKYRNSSYITQSTVTEGDVVNDSSVQKFDSINSSVENVSSQYSKTIVSDLNRCSVLSNRTKFNLKLGTDSKSEEETDEATSSPKCTAAEELDASTIQTFDTDRTIADINESFLPLPVFESTARASGIIEHFKSNKISNVFKVPNSNFKEKSRGLTSCNKLAPEDDDDDDDEGIDAFKSCQGSPLFESTVLGDNDKLPVIKRTSFAPCKNPLKDVSEQSSSIVLKTGKKWMRSESILKQLQNGSILLGVDDHSRIKGRKFESFVEEVLEMQPSQFQDTIMQTSLNVPDNKHMLNITSMLSNMTIGNRSMSRRHTIKVVASNLSEPSEFRTALGLEGDESKTRTDSVDSSGDETLKAEGDVVTARDVVLQRCGQTAPVPFGKYFNEKTLRNCKKIGEGVYGEVFIYNDDTVIKIIPIEGSEEVNGEHQKKFEEILSEIVIAMELSNLRKGESHCTNGFSELKRCWCVQGKYPKHLLNLWNEYDVEKGSENDSPVMFKSDQLYIVLELANGGRDLESFVFNNAQQSLSILIQTAFSLAIAEKALEFEHRDMHWGNILIAKSDEKFLVFLLDGVEYKVATRGVKVNIIDFTLSRMSYDGCCIFNDLAVDPTLFTSYGDYQFEIYRMMQKEVKNDWSLFKPATNIFWLHYTIDKMILMARYKNKCSKTHKTNIQTLYDLKSVVLNYENSTDFVIGSELENF